MDLLASRGQIEPSTRVDIARNRLVLVTPSAQAFVPLGAVDLLSSKVRRIAVAAAPVPAGRRAREALTHAELLSQVRAKFVVARNVRGALALAAQGQVDAAIVYRSDALASNAVRIAFEFPTRAHAPIVYAAALTAKGLDDANARACLGYLRGPQAREVFATAGFAVSTEVEASQPPRQYQAPPSVDAALPVQLSLWVATLSLSLSLLPAIALGWLLARREFIGKSLLTTVLLTPLVLPPVVVGFILLEAFGRDGPLAWLPQLLGVEVAFTQLGAVVAAAVVGFPLLVVMSRLAIEAVDVRYEQVAQTLGLTPLRAFVRITLPMALPGLAAGCVLAFARALGEFGATAVLASDIPGQTRTLALAIFSLYEQPGLEHQAHRLVWISLALCAAALVAYEALTRLQKRRLAE